MNLFFHCFPLILATSPNPPTIDPYDSSGSEEIVPVDDPRIVIVENTLRPDVILHMRRYQEDKLILRYCALLCLLVVILAFIIWFIIPMQK